MEMFQEGRLWNDEPTPDCHKSRKRKLDKDGFVVPNSPDRFSGHYDDNLQLTTGFDMNERFKDIGNEANGAGDSETLSGYSKESLPMGDGAASEDTGDKMLQLFEDFKMETVSVFEQWSRILCESEDFETKCPQKLDRMIDEAKIIDESLNVKKELLKQKLTGLENTLQVM